MEVCVINKQKFLVELSRLLGFMSAWDRETELDKYKAMFDESENEDEVIASLGSPTQLAISIAREYVPSPRPEPEDTEDEPAPEPEAVVEFIPEPEENGPETASFPAPESVPEPTFEADGEEFKPEETDPVFDTDAALEPNMLSALENSGKSESLQVEPEDAVPAEYMEMEEESPAPSRRKARPVALVFYIIASVIIGLPIALILILIGVPFLLLGGGVIVGAIYAAAHIIPALSMFSDVFLVAGTGLGIAGIGLLIAWFGFWVSIELGCAWIGGVIFRLGGKLCFKKEAPEA